MEDWEIKGPLGKIDEKLFDVVKSTIGFDLVSTQPQTKEEYYEYQKHLKEERELWEKEHPEQVKQIEEFNKKMGSKKPYIPAPWEREIIKRMLKMNDKSLDSCDITILDDGDISVSTCKESWWVLAGREWWINIAKGTCNCVAMS